MQVIMSPSKTFFFRPVQKGVKKTEPRFLNEAVGIVEILKIKKHGSLKKILGVSDKLADINAERFSNWTAHPSGPEAERAAWAYRGETYFGLSAEQMSLNDIRYMNEHLNIISGLYGLLRPTDLILPYRLEMSSKFKGKWGKNLYDFWGRKLADELMASESDLIVNCASEEYAKAIRPHIPESIAVITPKFLAHSPTGLKSKMVFAKYTRGLFARWVIENKIEKPKQLSGFDLEGYVFNEELSNPNQPIFVAPKDFTLKGRYKKT